MLSEKSVWEKVCGSELQKHLPVSVENQLLYYQSHILDDSTPIVSYGVSSGSVLSVIKYDRTQKASSPADTLQSLIQDIRKNGTQVSALMVGCESMIATLHQLSTATLSPSEATDFNYQLSNCQTEATELANQVSLLAQKCSQLQSAFSKMQPTISEPADPSNPPEKAETAEDTEESDYADLPGLDALQDYLLVLGRRHHRVSVSPTGVTKPERQSHTEAESIPEERRSMENDEQTEEDAATARPNNATFQPSDEPQEKEINELIEMNEGDLAIDAMDANDAYVQEAEECEWNETYDEATLREEISEYEHPPRIYNIEDTEVDDLSKRADFERTIGSGMTTSAESHVSSRLRGAADAREHERRVPANQRAGPLLWLFSS